MPVYDQECQKCGKIFERICSINEDKIPCPDCGSQAHRIISARGHFCANEDAEWIRSVREVIDSDNPLPAAQRFLKEPTRANYKRWMKAQGLRPLENNERIKPEPFNEKRHFEKVMQAQRKKRRITIV